MHVDSFTLFAANAVILLVTAVAFFAAWRGQRHEVYWASWIAANTTLGTALILFLLVPGGRDSLPMALANSLLVAGFGLRWRAARQFGRRAGPLAPTLVPTLVIFALFALPALFDYGMVYTTINVVLAAQAFAAAYEFWRDRADGLPSRYGLVLAYGVMGTSFMARVGQGLLLNGGMTSYLPQDVMLQIHLLIALFYTTASGAFALSIAYERGAAHLREAALRDPLTGIHNRRAFELRVQEVLDTGRRGQFAVVLFDIDHFKRINDRYGHAAGDVALRACAETCIRTLRPEDFVARIGGEEFAAILPDISAETAFDVADRVRRAVGASEIACHGSNFRLTLSAGIVHSPTGAGTMDDLMKRADAGLYRAKSSGRNKIQACAA